MADSGDAWVAIDRTSSEAEGRRHSLVLQAIGITHRLYSDAGEFVIAVEASDAARSLAELDAFARENRVEPVPTHARHCGDGWNGVLGFVAVLSLMAVVQKRQLGGVDWFSLGKTHAGLIRGGQWWRAVTALTLHTDLEHVLSNLFFGSVVGLFAGQALGSGLAWCGILVAGGLGNLVNAYVRPAEHTSIGASTAVFAALGLLASYAWQLRRTIPDSRLQRWSPIVGGLLLLSFLGTGGGRTDVGAHVLGFFCAIPFGILVKVPHCDTSRFPRAQVYFGMIALAILGVAWGLAGATLFLREQRLAGWAV